MKQGFVCVDCHQFHPYPLPWDVIDVGLMPVECKKCGGKTLLFFDAWEEENNGKDIVAVNTDREWGALP